ncbi:MAG: GNAT family N-acetyltransferase [Candidatus Competibacteraceae bacterium]|jgi:GNAT superfamily N-acetyltransferase|nr:GNAT family N-acetyltransferase [Candidatus Competibacteraceae bacterium]
MLHRRVFDWNYRERVNSLTGIPLLLRLIVPEDKEKLIQGFEALSSRSRYARFFAPKNGLTENELKFYTETDGTNHFAMGAVQIEPDGVETRGVAIARFVRSTKDPTLADVAITVIDEMQGQGIGRILLERIIAAARERGVKRFRFQLLGRNEKAKNLVLDICPTMTFTHKGEIMSAETALDDTGKDLLEGLFDVLRLIASRAILTPLQAGLHGAEMAIEAIAHGGEALAKRVSHGHDTSED